MFVLFTNRLGKFHGKALAYAKHTSVANGAADKTPQNVICPDIARLYGSLRIAENKRSRAHVVGDDSAGAENFIIAQLIRRLA